jgi:malate dehydrogenase (oxaloacetate-decarboxylating)(NADP+)
LEPSQGNNAYIFPGVSLGVICAGIRHISDDVFLTAAEVLAQELSDEDESVGRLYPRLSEIRRVSIKIATKIATEAYLNGTASTYPEPDDIEKFIRSSIEGFFSFQEI